MVHNPYLNESIEESPEDEVDNAEIYGTYRSRQPTAVPPGYEHRKSRKWCYIWTAVLVLIIVIMGAALGSRRSSSTTTGSASKQDNSVENRPDNNDIGLIELKQFIKLYSPNGAAIDKVDSYQYNAFTWLEDSTNVQEHGVQRTIQRYALACIYFSTYQVRNPYTDEALAGNGTQPIYPWQDSRGWLSRDDECTWQGITCDDDTGLVTGIDLSSNMLTGSMPEETSMLKETLTMLDLYGNYLYNEGEEGNAWLGELENIEILYLAGNAFSYDGIPSSIGKLSTLKELDVSYTIYFGAWDADIFTNLQALEFLYVGGLSFNSSVPSIVGQLPNLTYFYAEDADLQGDLSFMIGMPKMFEFWVDDNPQLTGRIPTQLGVMSTLESFSVSNCDLTGPIPSQLGQLTKMQQMWLYNNRLTGNIPSSLANLTRMRKLRVDHNLLQGSMPTEMCALAASGVALRELGADCSDDVTGHTATASGLSVTCACCTCCSSQCALDHEANGLGVGGNGGN